MTNGKWVEFSVLSYVGIALALGGIVAPNLLENNSHLIKLLGTVLFLIGVYLIFKGGKTRGL